jgi:Na+:H+ antiporter, NhaA family
VTPTPRYRPLLNRGSSLEARRISDVLRMETVGGALLLTAAGAALVWANSPWAESYRALRDLEIGPVVLHLHLSLGTWAADGLLAVFFFVAGLELKREFVAGDLRDPARAAVPVAAALAGVGVPAAVYAAVNMAVPNGDQSGWAIPTATDIAFALAVLAITGSHLPSALRTFLLTLAVVDDLLAIVIIAAFYTRELSVLPLLLALIPLVLFTLAVQHRIKSWWLLLPLAATTWALFHASGVHATVAGVLLGFAVPVLRRDEGTGPGLAEHFEHRWRPVSASVAVPMFAFFAAGVTVGGLGGARHSLGDPVALGVVAGLVVGKPVGILAATWGVARYTRARLDASLSWWDVVGLAMLGGVGFTVSLLIGELAFGPGSSTDDNVKIAVLVGSLLAAVLASVVLRSRNAVYQRIRASQAEDADLDGMPDAYER